MIKMNADISKFYLKLLLNLVVFSIAFGGGTALWARSMGQIKKQQVGETKDLKELIVHVDAVYDNRVVLDDRSVVVDDPKIFPVGQFIKIFIDPSGKIVRVIPLGKNLKINSKNRLKTKHSFSKRQEGE